MPEAQEKLNKLSRDVLILSRNTLLVNLRFLDAALSQFELVPVNAFNLMTDGKHIFYNPSHVLKCYKEAKEIPVRDYLHIVMHCVFRHMYMSPSLERIYWDLACDIAVENMITELGLRTTATTKEWRQTRYVTELKKKLKIITAEKVYAHLWNKIYSPEELAELQELFAADEHDAWYMNDDEISQRFGVSSDSNSGYNPGQDGDYEQGDGGRSAMADMWKAIAERMQVDIDTFGKQRGISPGAMVQNLAAVNRERYDYTAFLKKFAVMGEAMKINDDEFDYIFYTYGLQLYKKMPLIEPLEYKEIKAIKEFVIAIDTSGSTSGELVQRFVQKTYNILKSTESFFTKINLHIIQCDTGIQEDKKITCQEDFDEYLNTMQIHGLGGTDFRPVFEYVEWMRQNIEFTNLKGLIYFTDGYGAFPAKKPDYDAAFVFIDDEYNNPDVPTWAIKLVLQKDEI